jgi:protein-tyrosine phosphatase
MIDLHSHILPGLDDGARSLREARELALAAAAEGVEAIAATPHVRSDYPTRPEQMEQGVAELRRDFADQGIAVDILHGGEIELGRLWEIPQEELVRLSLGQTGRYVLLEFPYRGWPMGAKSAIYTLRNLGMTPLFAHPERNPAVQDDPQRLEPLVDTGAIVQITAASLEGGLGPASQNAAVRLVQLGLVHVLATDAHGPHIRAFGLASAAAHLGNPALASYLTTDAPAAIVRGEPLPPFPR